MDEKATLVKNWLIKAQHDLIAAKKLSLDLGICLDVAIYHCQQAGEKAIKGFLVFHDQPFPKTHDLRLLAQLALRIDSRFEQHQEAAEILTPYATEFRYPGDILEPTAEEMREALEKAEGLLDVVTLLINQPA
ncbi:HEPN domain-containing protein [Methylomagnum sp.]